MADNNLDPLGETLESRYSTDHVGGAFNAKNIQKPRPTEKILKEATLGKNPDESMMLDGLNLDRYRRHDDILPENKVAPVLVPRKVPPKSVTNIVSGGGPIGIRPIVKKPDPGGSGMPGVPLPKPPVLVGPPPFGPVIRLPISIYWNTDPDKWDFSGSRFGQTFWDSGDAAY